VDEAWGQFENPKEGERPALEAGTRGLVPPTGTKIAKCWTFVHLLTF
jgi:hypothetical protein